MSQREQLEEIVAFVEASMHGWTHQPTAKIVNAGIASNPTAECVEITVMVGHTFSEELNDYWPETSQEFSIWGAKRALGY